MRPTVQIGIVEDSREDYVDLARILGPGVVVEHWQTAEQALPALTYGQLEDLALVIIDGRLPGMDGADLVRAIRETPRGRQVRLVMLSGSSDPRDAERAIEAGADRYVQKGTTIQELKAAVATCIEGLPQLNPRANIPY